MSGGGAHDEIDVDGTASDGAVTILPSAGDDRVTVNDDGIGQANAVFDATQRIGSLTLRDAAAARLTAGGAKVLTITGLALIGTGTLDLADNSMVFDYGPVSPINGMRTALSHGFNGGAWDGSGIISSAAAASGSTGIGFAEASELFAAFPATFKGQGVDSSSVVLSLHAYRRREPQRHGEPGRLQPPGRQLRRQAKRWSQGDFNYDGVVNLGDFNRLAANFGRTSAAAAAVAQLHAPKRRGTTDVSTPSGRDRHAYCPASRDVRFRTARSNAFSGRSQGTRDDLPGLVHDRVEVRLRS